MDSGVDMRYIEAMEAGIPKSECRTRFAPSPTGYMHVGNLRTALYTYLIAKRLGGTFILRIEDTDQSRLIEGALDVILNTLSECGLNYDEGPDIGGPAGPYIQTQRREIYRNYAELLISRGGAYRCFCGKEEPAEDTEEDAPPAFSKYDGRCSRLTAEEIAEKLRAGAPYVVRQKIPAGGHTTFKDLIFGEITVANDTLDDNVLIKSDGLPTYNFANVIDDHLMGISHVVRGTEYLSSAPKYNLLYESFGWDVPNYVHCPPVMRDARNKMSKRHGDPSYEDLKADGFLTEAILNYVALLGWSPGGEVEKFALPELEQVFEISGISKSPAIFDIEKLTYFNGEYIRAMTPEQFTQIAEPYIRQAVENPGIDPALIAATLQQRTGKLTEIPSKLGFFDELPEYGVELYTNKKSKTDAEISLKMLMEAKALFEGLEDWSDQGIHDALMGLAENLGEKNAALMWPVRIAVSGSLVTPGGAVELCHILGKGETLRRIGFGIAKLEAQK